MDKPYYKEMERVTLANTGSQNLLQDIVVSLKAVCFFPNNRPLTSDIKDLLNSKRAFKDGVRAELKHAQRKLKMWLRERNESYKRKVRKTKKKP